MGRCPALARCLLTHYWLSHGGAITGYQLAPVFASRPEGPQRAEGACIMGETEAPWKFEIEKPSWTSLVLNTMECELDVANLEGGEFAPPFPPA